MRMRKHFATGAALAAAAAMILTACGGGGDAGSTGSAAGGNGELNVGPAYTTTDYGPLTSSRWPWVALAGPRGLYRLDRTNYSVSPALAPVIP